MTREEFYTVAELEEMWKIPLCDTCGQSNTIVRQHFMDGKLMCGKCWKEMIRDVSCLSPVQEDRATS